MRTIYIDSDFICHTENGQGRTAVETGAFDGLDDLVINNYRFVPQGQTWVRQDGVEFHGQMSAPIKDYDKIMLDLATSYLDDDQAESVTVLFEEWQSGVAYAVGDRRQYDGLLYRCVQAHTSQADWYPPAVPALWVRTSTEEWPEWIQPTGAHDAYNKGDKCSYKGKHWICTIDGNVYAPDVYGWEEVIGEE